MIQGSWFTPWRLPRSAGQASTAQADRRSHGTVRERRPGKSGRGALVAKLGHPPAERLLGDREAGGREAILDFKLARGRLTRRRFGR